MEIALGLTKGITSSLNISHTCEYDSDTAVILDHRGYMNKIIRWDDHYRKFQPKIYILYTNFEKEQPHIRAIRKMVPQTLNAGSASLCLGLSDISITHYNQHSSPVYKFGTKQSIRKCTDNEIAYQWKIIHTLSNADKKFVLSLKERRNNR